MTHPLTTVILIAALCAAILSFVTMAAVALAVAFVWESWIFYLAGSGGR